MNLNMRHLSVLILFSLNATLFSQNLEVEGTVKVTDLEKTNTSDSIVVWLQDSTLGMREAATLNKQLVDSDGDTRILVEEQNDEDIIHFYLRDSQVMVIDTNGMIGIGDTMPQEAISVQGGNLLQRPAKPRLKSSLTVGTSPASIWVAGPIERFNGVT